MRILPPFMINWLGGVKHNINLLVNYAYDYSQYKKWSSVVNRPNTQTKLKALITMGYHMIEKGLSLEEPRVGFGSDTIELLLSQLLTYKRKYGLDETTHMALNVLVAYRDFNLRHGLQQEKLSQSLSELMDTIPDSDRAIRRGGVLKVTKQAIHEAAKIDLNAFFKFRYSIRQFTSDEVDMTLIEKAVKMAQKTPSVCNRQSAKVWVLTRDEDKLEVLRMQDGAHGFGDRANKILIVTSNLCHFVSVGERYQCWIDGGMFAMSLVYAIHSLGLATCCLNWSVEKRVDCELKKFLAMSDSETIIIMIAVGHLPEKLEVAQSPRKPLSEVLVVR